MMLMRHPRRKFGVCISILLMMSLAVTPFVLTWREVRQSQLDRLLVNAINKGDTQLALSALNSGANGNADIPDEDAPVFSFATLLRARLTGKSVPAVHGTPCLLAVLGIEAAHWRPVGMRDNIPPPPPENPRLVDALLAHGANANSFGIVDENWESRRQITPLLLALRWRYERVARLLVSKGAQVNLANANGETPLMEAVCGDPPVSLRTLDFLMAHGANIKDRDNDGKSVLIYAVIQGEKNADILSDLIQHHADIDAVDHRGQTALIYAVENLNVAEVNTLISNHARVNIEGEQGTALYYARRQPIFQDDKERASARRVIIALLKGAGAKE
jgi:hypothetical protein